jgi:hypothetical protein
MGRQADRARQHQTSLRRLSGDGGEDDDWRNDTIRLTDGVEKEMFGASGTIHQRDAERQLLVTGLHEEEQRAADQAVRHKGQSAWAERVNGKWDNEDLDVLYESIRPTPQYSHEVREPEGLTSTLRGYQRKALSWMMWREGNSERLANPQWEQYTLADASTIYFNQSTGSTQRERPPTVRDTPGGILAEGIIFLCHDIQLFIIFIHIEYFLALLHRNGSWQISRNDCIDVGQ